MAVTINEGTQTDIYTKLNAGTEIQVIKLDMGAGTAIEDFSGTIKEITNIAGGTVTANIALDSGTITTGSLSNVAMLHDGTIASVGTVPGIGSITNIGTIGSIVGMPAATLTMDSGTITTGSLGNVAMLHAGTVTISGTVPVSGASAGTDVNLVTGTVTTGSLANIGFIHEIGTMPAISIGESTGGTLDVLGSIGTIAGVGGVVQVSGTVSTGGAGTQPVNMVTGTITTGSISNLAMIHAGTLTSSGTTTGVGVVSNLTNGSVRMTVGTLTTGSLSNVAMIHAGTHVHPTGTVTTIVAGTQNTLGTVAVVNNIVTGTLASVTLSNKFTGSQILTASVLGTAGGSLFGTLSAASGAGTSHFVTGLQIVMSSGTADVYVGFGTGLTGGSVLARGNFPAGGGIMRDFTFPIQSGTNSEICYEFAGAGTAFIAVNYWKGV